MESRLSEVGSMEQMALKNQQGVPGEHDNLRKVLQPKVHAYMRTMDPSACADLQQRVFDVLESKIRKLRERFVKMQEGLDERRVFSGDANAQRVQTRYLAALRREISVHGVEEKCLAEMMGCPRREASSRLLKSASAPELKKESVVEQPKKSSCDTDVFEGYLRWQSAVDRNSHDQSAKMEGSPRLAPLPLTSLLAQTFSNFGTSESRMVGTENIELCNATLLAMPGENSATGGSARLKGNNITPFANSFLKKQPDLEAITVLEEEQEEEPEEEHEEEELLPLEKKIPCSPTTTRNRRRLADEADPVLLQPRLELIWSELELPTAAKLKFMQKYATFEFAALLPRAVTLWAAAAHALTRKAKLVGLQTRLWAGEDFAGPDLVSLVCRAVHPDQLPLRPPDHLNEPTCLVTKSGIDNLMSSTVQAPQPTEDGAPAPAAEDPWLGAVIAHYSEKALEIAQVAQVELGDTIPQTTLL